MHWPIPVNQDTKAWSPLTGAQIVHTELMQYNDTVQYIKLNKIMKILQYSTIIPTQSEQGNKATD